MPVQKRNLLFVVNPKASHYVEGHFDELLAAHFPDEREDHRIIEIDGPERVDAAIDAAFAESRYDAIVAAGGDGTVMGVIPAVFRHGCLLGIIPHGTGNLLAGSLGIPTDESAAIGTLLSENIEELYPSEINGRLFAMACGVGIDAEIIAGAPSEKKRRFGVLAYLMAGIQSVFSFRSRRFDLELDGVKRRVRCKGIMVINRRNFLDAANPMTFLSRLPGAAEAFGVGVRDHTRDQTAETPLDVCIIRIRHTPEYIPTLIQLFSGKLDRDHPNIEHLTAHQVRITSRSPGQVKAQADGDLLEKLPIEITRLTRAVPVIVPE